ncbi:hypothetical protein HD599_000410 [Conyzicola lurida]|uniref:Helicase XPB/Ssl2 N-terminal domain-containing protein n=1 Tax=Conyzicola lurida TaxID=1172621 RepID=A0A841AFS0_9MICO|nr:helicase-associated domain-containing protein [Conyzicola lurida]MBB5842087.1 hypothetical protein [Conyzicola lurida]
MPANSSSTLALAGRLRASNDTDLVTLLRARSVRDVGIGDFFDLADKLLDRTSIQSALSALDRPTLTTLGVVAEMSGADAATDAAAIADRRAALGAPADAAQIAEHLATAESLGLVDRDDSGFRAWDAVVDQLAEWPLLDLPTLAELARPWQPSHDGTAAIDERATDALAAEHAFATTMAVVELVSEHQHEPARELAKGGLALPDLKRLATAASIELDQVAALHGIAVRSGLLVLDGTQWVPTTDAGPWMQQSTPDVWARLAGAWLAELPRDIRTLLAGRTHDRWDEEFVSLVAWLYPAGGQWMHDRVVARVRAAELLGVIAGATPSTPGGLLLTEGPDAAAAAMATMLPREVEQVYVQNDLSIVSPGPLAPRLDARLRTIAAVESHALASSYRVSPASVNRAFALGETASSITDFLGTISLTGIPQPLSYLIAEAAARYGLVRVGSIEGGRSYVRSTDENLLGAILVDQSLSALSLHRDAMGRAVSRYDESVVFWALSEARYPVAAENADGETHALARPQAAPPVRQPVANVAAEIVSRLREVAPEAEQDNDRAWMERQLDAAVKARLTIAVTVTVQDGSSVDYVLEPTGLGGGRLRARDRKADIERTLPLSRITSVSSAV